MQGTAEVEVKVKAWTKEETSRMPIFVPQPQPAPLPALKGLLFSSASNMELGLS